jgi:hypothetical protein
LKLPLFILVSLYTTIALGQSFSCLREQRLSDTSELRKVVELPDSIFNQSFYRSYGVHGDAFVLNRNKTFDFYHGLSVSYSGKWKNNDKGLLHFVSKERPMKSFYVMSFRHYYYLIPELEKEAFVEKFLLLKDKHKDDKPFELEGRIFTTDDNIAIDLGGGNYWIKWI